MAQDLGDTWWIILLSLMTSCLLSYLWLLAMRLLASTMVWVSIIAGLAGLAGLTAASGLRLANILVLDDPDINTSFLQLNWTPFFLEDLLELKDTWLVLTLGLGTLLVIILLLLVFLRHRIFLAVALIEQASLAVSQVGCLVSSYNVLLQVPSSLLFPLVPFLMQLVSLPSTLLSFCSPGGVLSVPGGVSAPCLLRGPGVQSDTAAREQLLCPALLPLHNTCLLASLLV